MMIIIGDRKLKAEGTVIVTFVNGKRAEFDGMNISVLFLNEYEVLSIEVLKE